MRGLDWRARNPKFIGKAPEDVVSRVREIVASIAGITP